MERDSPLSGDERLRDVLGAYQQQFLAMGGLLGTFVVGSGNRWSATGGTLDKVQEIVDGRVLAD